MDDPQSLQRALTADAMLLAPEWTLPPGWTDARTRRRRQRRALRRRRSARRRGAAPSAALTPVALPQRLLMPGFVDAHHHLTQSLRQGARLRRAVGDLSPHLGAARSRASMRRALYLSREARCTRGAARRLHDGGATPARALRRPGSTRWPQRRAMPACAACSAASATTPASRRRRRVRSPRPSAISRGASTTRWSHPSLAVSIPEAATDAMLHAASPLCAREAGAVFQIHVNEHLASVERSLVARGLRPLEHLHAAGALGPQTLLRACHAAHAATSCCCCATAAPPSRYNPVASAVEGQRGAPTLPAGGAWHSLRPRHRRHAQRRLPADGRRRGDAAPRLRPGQRRFVVRRRLALARPRDPLAAPRPPAWATSPARRRSAWPPTSCSSTSTCRS